MSHPHAWSILNAYYQEHPHFLTQHHLDSFNDFMGSKLQETVRSMNPVSMVREDPTDKKVYSVDIYMGGDPILKESHGVSFDTPSIHDGIDDASKPLWPREARLADRTYGVNIFADVHVVYRIDGEPLESKDFEKVHIGFIPVMLHSRACLLHGLPPDSLRERGECPYDMGGYFLINGREKVIVTQEEKVSNRLYIRRGGTSEDNVVFKAFIRCIAAVSTSADVFPRTYVFHVLTNNAINITVTHLDGRVPLCILFRALGIESDRAILEHIVGGSESQDSDEVDFVRASILDSSSLGVYSQKDAIAYLLPKTRFKTQIDLKNVLTNDVFPNVGLEFNAKALLLGSLTRQIVRTALGKEPVSILDDYRNKRLVVSGFLVANLFRDVYLEMRNGMVKAMNNEFQVGAWRISGDIRTLVSDASLKGIVQPRIVGEGITRALKGTSKVEDGVVQDLSRVSYLTYVSHIRRVNNPIDRTVKVADPHRMRASHWGAICPVESPDGPNIGILNHLAGLCVISPDSPESEAEVRNVIIEMGAVHMANFYGEGVSRLRLEYMTPVYINDTWVAAIADPSKIVEKVRDMRRHGGLATTVSVAWNIWQNQLHIHTDRGRCCRPMIIVGSTWSSSMPSWMDGVSSSKTKVDFSSVSWTDLLLKHQIVEFIDIEELATCLVAMSPSDIVRNPLNRYTHMEIHPATILSAVANTFPMLNHNFASYNVLCLAQFKQAIGTPVTSFRERMDTEGYVLHHPQRPMVSTNFADQIFGGRLAHGENIVVAIATYTGYNQEDSVLINMDSVQRGRLAMTFLETRRYEESEAVDEQNNNVRWVFANPGRLRARGYAIDERGGGGSAASLDKHGFPVLNSLVGDGDALMGMVRIASSPANSSELEYKDTSERMNLGGREKGYFVDSVFEYPQGGNNSGLRSCKVRLRQMREPELGDKMASRFGQKGVVGMLLPSCDMPFSERDGVIPDIILNPNAFPKRMTVTHLLECLLGKAGAVSGTRYNVDTFGGTDVLGEAQSVLEGHGFEKHGDEVLHNGRTGERMSSRIFMGINYYGRLKHMVEDKYQSRSSGPVSVLVHQPTKGGSGASGGLRIGEMEQNAILAHGMGAFLKESFVDRSDRYQFEVDRQTGEHAGWWTGGQGGDAEVPRERVMVETPYAFKLLQQEMQSMSIDTRMTFEDASQQTFRNTSDT